MFKEMCSLTEKGHIMIRCLFKLSHGIMQWNQMLMSSDYLNILALCV